MGGGGTGRARNSWTRSPGSHAYVWQTFAATSSCTVCWWLASLVLEAMDLAHITMQTSYTPHLWLCLLQQAHQLRHKPSKSGAWMHLAVPNPVLLPTTTTAATAHNTRCHPASPVPFRTQDKTDLRRQRVQQCGLQLVPSHQARPPGGAGGRCSSSKRGVSRSGPDPAGTCAAVAGSCIPAMLC